MATYSGAELKALMSDLESDLVERKESAADGRKIRRNVCAFANDLPESTPQARASSSEEGVEGIEGMALPVYVGKMIYVGNWATSPAWGDLPGRIDLDSDFLLGADDLRHDSRAGSRVVFRDISNSTNERSFVSALLPGLFPCGNKDPGSGFAVSRPHPRDRVGRIRHQSRIRLGSPAGYVRDDAQLAHRRIVGAIESGLGCRRPGRARGISFRHPLRR